MTISDPRRARKKVKSRLRRALSEEAKALVELLSEEEKEFLETLDVLGIGLREQLRVASLKSDVREMMRLMTLLDIEQLTDDVPLPQRILDVVRLQEATSSERYRRGENRLAAREAIIRGLGHVCPQCEREVSASRRWHVSRDSRYCMCRRCWAERSGNKLGRARTGEPPVDNICPQCKRVRTRRRQWDLRNGICKRCSRRAETSSS